MPMYNAIVTISPWPLVASQSISKTYCLWTPLGTFTVEVHKRNVSPQNLFQDPTLNDHYIYEIIYSVVFFSLDTHILLD
jgi:hypothetical protein